MNGLALSRRYFERFGQPMLAELCARFPELEGQFCAGLAGHGSECFGFDDAWSEDHDFGPSFCLWLPRELFARYGAACQKTYDALPGEFEGHPARRVTAFGQDRVGVLCLEDFYFGLIGRESAPADLMEWMALPEDRRVAVVLFYYEDMTVEQIAKCLNVPVGTVKSRLNRAREQLKELLKED